MSKTLDKLGQRIADLHDTYDVEVKYNHYNPKQRKQLYEHLTRPKKKRDFAKEQIDKLKNNYNRYVTISGSNLLKEKDLKIPKKLRAEIAKDNKLELEIDISPIFTPRVAEPAVQKPKTVKKPLQGLAGLLGVE